MAIFVSENGILKSPKERIDRTDSKKYTQIKKAGPVSIIYQYFYLTSNDLNHKTDALLISHFLKPKATKNRPPEIVAYFDTSCPLKKDSSVRIVNFDPQNFGHRLIYYTKSYLGDSIDFTTKATDVHELAGGKKLVKMLLQNAIPLAVGAAGLPTFLLPFTKIANDKNFISQGIDLFFGKLFPQKSILKSNAVSLSYDIPGRDLLQSGRYVVIPQIGNDIKKKRNILEKFKLNKDHQLVLKNKPDEEYLDNSYYVFQVNGKSRPSYKNFETASGTAEILSNIIGHKEVDISSIATTISSALGHQTDIDALKKIASGDLDNETRDAYVNLLSDNLKKLVKDNSNTVKPLL